MDELKIGDLILVRDDSFIGNVIEWAQRGKYSHVAFYAGNGLTLEADGGRPTGFRALSDFPTGQYDIGRVEATEEERLRAYAYAASKIGTRYNWLLLVLFILELAIGVDWPYRSRKSFICSTYVLESWRSAGKVLTTKDSPGPQDIADSPLVSVWTPTTERVSENERSN